MLTVIAHYRTLPNRSDEVAATLGRHVAATRREPGCVQFTVNRSTEDPEGFVLYEQYVDEDAFEQHRGSSHFEEYILGTVVPLLAERTFQRYVLVEPDEGP